MIEELKRLQQNSYSPYSHYAVSAIVVMKDGTMFPGVNVENASFGATICAERNAILSAITAGYHKGDFLELYVMVSSGEIGMPCFLCRQVISEFFDKNSIVHCCATDGKVEDYMVSELCPYPFGEEDLK